MEPYDPEAVRAAVEDPERLTVLRATGLLDADPAPLAQHVVQLVRDLLHVPVALVSLVDRDRQFFAAESGLAEPFHSDRQTPLAMSLCQRSVASGQPVVIDDAQRHPDVRESGAVVTLGVTAYAGVPLRTSTGHVLGALCAIDRRARAWAPTELRMLEQLAELARTEIEYRLRFHQLARADEQIAHLDGPVAKLGDTIQTMAATSHALGPRAARLASLVQQRFADVATVAEKLQRIRTVIAEPLGRRFLTVDLVDQLTRAIEEAAPGPASDSVRLHVVNPGIAVLCDRYGLQRSLVHVLVSALHHVVEGEDVEVWLDADDQQSLVTVQYKGAPMPAVDIARIVSLVQEATCTVARTQDVGATGLTLRHGTLQTDNGVVSARVAPTASQVLLRLPHAAAGSRTSSSP